MRIVLAPDARFLLIKAAREITFHYRNRLIEDVARECGLSSKRLDEILNAFVKAGLWAHGRTLRGGYVTRAGVSAAVDQSMRYAA